MYLREWRKSWLGLGLDLSGRWLDRIGCRGRGRGRGRNRSRRWLGWWKLASGCNSSLTSCVSLLLSQACSASSPNIRRCRWSRWVDGLKSAGEDGTNDGRDLCDPSEESWLLRQGCLAQLAFLESLLLDPGSFGGLSESLTSASLPCSHIRRSRRWSGWRKRW